MALDLSHRRPEAPAKRIRQRLDELPLPLQVSDLPEMQANLDQLDERSHRAHALLQSLLDLPGLEELEDVALLDVGVALEHNAALHPLIHLGDVVLEAPQRADLAGPDDRPVADEAHVGVAGDL